MSNGARHGLGVVIGLIVTPVITACLLFGANKLRLAASATMAKFQSYHGSELWIGAGVIVVAAILLGLIAGTRLSPLASLIPGVAFGALGLLWVADPLWTLQNTSKDPLPSSFASGYLVFGPYGVFLLLGVALIVASLAPSRWKARAAAGAAPHFGAPPPAPMGPPPMHGAPAPMGAPHPPPAQSPSWQGAPQQYGAQPAQPAASNPPPLPPASPASPAPPPAAEKKPEPSIDSDDDGPGEWTRMYGGDRPK